MRRGARVLSAFVAVVGGASSALAQHHGGGGQARPAPTATTSGSRTSSGGGVVHGTRGGGGTFTISKDRTRNAAADAARAKAAAGDCKAALDLFDEAISHSIDPTLRRDRGICHDKLGDVFPALDDYRAYVSQAPDASDLDKYRNRINELTAQASQDMAPGLGSGGDFDAEMRGGMTDGSTPAGAPKPILQEEAKTTRDEPDKSLSTIEYEETRDQQARNSPLRRGKGFVLGAFYHPRYVFNDWSFGFGQAVGATVGWSFSRSGTLLLELGYINQSGTTTKDGFMSLLGYEGRIALDGWATNQIVLGVGAGYENLTDNTLGVAYACVVGRGRAGYRHVFGPSFALDVYADGGVMGTFVIDPSAGAESAGIGGFVGGVAALEVGF